MITTQRCILIATKENEFLERFEAIEYADISKIQDVWKRNETLAVF